MGARLIRTTTDLQLPVQVNDESPRGGRAAALIAISAALLFVVIAAAVIYEGSLTTLDFRTNDWLHAHGTRGLIIFYLCVSRLHSSLFITLGTLAVCAYLWFS